MASKQSDCQSEVLSDFVEEATAQSSCSLKHSFPSPALGREWEFSEGGKGAVRKVTQVLLDPSRVRVWHGNARLYRNLTGENCRELIDSILAEGGQKVPAVVRRVEGDFAHDYEVVAGIRRHFAISWLRRNSYPDVQFLAEVTALDDEAAFRLADLENRVRKDLSDIERARNYAAALQEHYGGHATRMAERLNISKGWLSKTLKAATLPDSVLCAFASINDIGRKPAYTLAVLLDDKAAAKAVLDKAQQITHEQAALRAAGAPPRSATQVVQRLIQSANKRSRQNPAKPFVHTGSQGRTALSVQSVGRQGVTIRLHAGSGADVDELVDGLRRALAHLEAIGQGLRR